MQSRRDQLQAYQFLRGRIVTALITGDPDSPEVPMRRLVRTAFAGVMIGAVLVAGFGLFGLIRPGGATSWQQDGALVIEKQTGARYVYFRGQLHPMLNYTSALLYAGRAGATAHSVSPRALEGTARTQPQGIAGAPDSLPAGGDLVREPWTVCAAPAGREAATVTLLAGKAPRSGALPDTQGLVVTDRPGGTAYVIWRDERLRVLDPKVLLPLGFQVPTPQVVGGAWVNALPQGPDLTFPAITGRGGTGPQLGSRRTRVGQVLAVRNVGRLQYALVLTGAVAPISPAVAALLLADPRTAQAYPGGNVRAVQIRPDVFTTAPKTAAPGSLGRYPAVPLQPADATAGRPVLCVTLTALGNASGRSQPRVRVTAVRSAPAAGRPTGGGDAGGLPIADQVYVPPGGGAVVQVQPQPGVTTGTRFLLSDQGLKYPITDQQALQALGYGQVSIPALPRGFLDLLPTGPALSREAAAQPAPSAGR